MDMQTKQNKNLLLKLPISLKIHTINVWGIFCF